MSWKLQTLVGVKWRKAAGGREIDDDMVKMGLEHGLAAMCAVSNCEGEGVEETGPGEWETVKAQVAKP